jgi:hypothetical protein
VNAIPSKLDPPAISVGELTSALSKPLGEVKANQVMDAAMQAENLKSDRLHRAEAVRLLDRITLEPGLVGISARFLKSRVLLRRA